MGQGQSKKTKTTPFKRPELFNYTKDYGYIQVANTKKTPIRIMSWNVLAEAYKGGHALNF